MGPQGLEKMGRVLWGPGTGAEGQCSLIVVIPEPGWGSLWSSGSAAG